MTATDELLPCPFCGGSEQRIKNSGRWGWFVSCSCAAVGPSAGNRDEAIIAWNCRHEPRQMRLELGRRTCAPEQAIEATLGRGTCRAICFDNLNESNGMGDAWEECSECGALLAVITDNQPTPNYCPNCGRKVVDA